MKNEEKIFTLLVLIITILMVIVSFQYSGGSRMLPLLSGIFTSLLMGFLVIMTFFPSIASRYQKFEMKSILSEKLLSVSEKKREFSVVAWFTGCTVLIYLLGFMIGIPLFLFLFLKIWAKESWPLSVVLAVVVPAIIYFTFVYLLNVPLHRGLLLA